MTGSASRVSFHNDPLSRTVMRLLLLLELGAMVVVLGLCLLDRFTLALLISSLTLFLFLTVIVYLYIRYQSLAVVREKKRLNHLVLKFEKKQHAEELRIRAAVKERDRLVQSEKREIHAALSNLQKNYIETGLSDASIKHGDIPGVGPKLKERLTDHGILNAGQVSTAIAQLPGFGEAKCQALLDWRSSVLAKLEGTKPSALPPEQLDRIQQKYHALQDQNNAAERKAISSQQILEHELMAFKPHLRALASITFPGYLRRSLASRGIAAALVAFVLVMTQVVSSVSATVAFGASNAAALMASIPVTGATATVSPTETRSQTSTPTDPLPSTATTIPSETRTATRTATETTAPTETFTALPTETLIPTVTPVPALSTLDPLQGVTAICNDGSYSYSQHRRGTCSHHGGVREWVNRPPN